jgi:AcrR family transcriptional regulator
MNRADSTERRNQILDAAAVVFAQRGLNQARMDDIVREAGLSKGTIYWYFSSKDAVIEALMHRLFAPEFDWLRAMVQEDGPVYDRMITFTERSIVVVQQVQEMGLLPLFAEYIALATRDEHARQVLQEYNETARALVVPLFAQAIERGEFRPVDPEIAYLNYAVLMDGLVLGEFVYVNRMSLQERIMASARLFLDGLRAR